MHSAPAHLVPEPAWVNASDTLNHSTGNPYLDPKLNHAVELAHYLNIRADLRYVDVKSHGLNLSNDGFMLSFNMNSMTKIPKNYSVQAFLLLTGGADSQAS